MGGGARGRTPSSAVTVIARRLAKVSSRSRLTQVAIVPERRQLMGTIPLGSMDLCFLICEARGFFSTSGHKFMVLGAVEVAVMSRMSKTLCTLNSSIYLSLPPSYIPFAHFFSPHGFPPLDFVILPLMETLVSNDFTLFLTVPSET